MPDGKYQIKIDETLINNAKTSGRLQVSWTATIVSNDQKGRKLFWHDGIDDDESRSWFRGKLARLGIEWPKVASDLPDKLEEAKGSYAEVTVKKKDEFVNVYVNKAIDSADVDDAAPAEEVAPPAAEESLETTATFDDEKLTPVHRKEIKKIAVLRDIDPDDYNALTDLMLDVAEGLGIFGEFDDPEALMKLIRKATA